MTISRHATRLFLERGVRGTTGGDIAAAAGISTRTLWRYFRTKESCVEPLLSTIGLRFTAKLRAWPRNVSIEEYLRMYYLDEQRTPKAVADEVLAVRLVAILPDEPDLRAAWLMSTQAMEEDLIEVIADRLERSVKDAEVRLCAATVAAALRVVDETISVAVIRHGQTITTEDIIERLGRAIRAASTLPICDPVVT